MTGALLQSVVDVARAIFGAAASSVFTVDRDTGELVFRAVSGAGEQFLVGTRFPGGRGIAGWVVGSGQAMIADDLTANRTFARDLAASTGYLPEAIMAVPLLAGEQVLGVLEVMDPARESRSDLGDLDLLALFANQAALALQVVKPCRCSSVPMSTVDNTDDLRSELLLDDFRRFLHQRTAQASMSPAARRPNE